MGLSSDSNANGNGALPTISYSNSLKYALTKITMRIGAGGPNFFEDYGVWKEAPILKGTTNFEPLPDVKNIMVTGGAGFM